MAFASQFGHMVPLEITETHTSPLSPPPYMVGAAEIELDKETGEVKVVDYAACVDCGTPINPNLTRVQTEGGILQGIGMALTENITYDAKGWPMENSFMQYKIPARVDIGHIRVEFESSYEPNGPFGAKSIGEVVINTPLPAIADAIYNAIGTRFYELPITPEQVAWRWKKTADAFGKTVSVSGGKGPCSLAGGRRRKNHPALCLCPALCRQRLAGAGEHHHPHPAARGELCRR